MSRPDYKNYFRYLGSPTRIANFHWIPGTRLAGCALPGARLRREKHIDQASSISSHIVLEWIQLHMRWLKERGIRALVCLDQQQEQIIRDNWKTHFASIRIQSENENGTDSSQIGRFLDFTKRMDQHRYPVAVCCDTGVGRTGVMLAIFLVSKGYEPLNAIERIRQTRRTCNICNSRVFENESQRRMIAEYAASMQNKKLKT